MAELPGQSPLALREATQEKVSNGSYLPKVEKFVYELSNKVASVIDGLKRLILWTKR